MAQKKKQGKFQNKKAAKVASVNDSTPKSKKASSTRPAVIICAALCICIGILACIFFLDKLGFSINLPGKTITAGVNIAGVDVGGLKKSEAEDAVTAAIGDSYSTESLVVTVLEKELEITPTISGANFDVDGAVREAFKYGTTNNPELQVDITPYLQLDTDAIQNLIAEFSQNFPTDGITTGSQIIQETIDGAECDVLEVTVGTVYYDFSADAMYDVILTAYNNHRFTASYTCNRFDAASIDLDALYAEYCTEAVDAVLDPDTLEVTQSATGSRFDLDSAKEALAAAQPGDVLKFAFEDVLPEMDTDTLKSMLFRDVLGTYTAYQSSSSDRATNLKLACESLDGIILYPGDTFNYNDALGERTPEKGYKPAAAYMDGETVQSYGGGICQPSSALYYCTLMADLEIVERHCHSYPSSYVPLGMDATVSWGGPEFKFKNNTDFPIRIDAEADGGSVTITLVGTDTKDYYVKMEYEVLSVTSPKVEYIEVKPGSGHKNGEVKTSGHTGYTVQSYKLKYSKQTDELISREKEAYSVYSTQTKVVYKYVSDEKKQETTTATESATTATKPTESTTATVPPTTVPPTTVPPTTPPATEPPATVPPVTVPSVGEAGSDVAIPGE